MKSPGRAELSRLMAESGGTGVLLLFKPLGSAQDVPAPPPDPLGSPRCTCFQHRVGAGVPMRLALPIKNAEEASGAPDGSPLLREILGPDDDCS
ncbi:hypothetical protein AB0I22_15400 [Streptomyces sp. NPDC050610]|uniref:hypothetical protein n=1 Tax=Streptomyces sp. NPDC050610 TaxID=3157097 RepID=UPI0034460904